MTHDPAAKHGLLAEQDMSEGGSHWPESAEAVYVSGGVWSAAPELLEGSVLQDSPTRDRYQLVCILGQGGMGQVWLGWDQHLERQVAIKRPRDETDPGSVRLTHEALMTAKLEHPGIVSIYDVYVEGELPHFVMRLVRGQPLARHIRAHHDSPQAVISTELLRYALRTCEAIGYAHRRGICHRDISPMNILVSDEGVTHIIDWGLACAIDECHARTQSVGTPGFTAPEQQRGQASGARADVWSLGAVLHHIVHGHAPGEGSSRRASSSSPELDAIIACALHEAPERRYRDALELAGELQRWFEGQRITAYHVTPWRLLMHVVRAYSARILFVGLMGAILLVSVVAGVINTRREALRAREAEQIARHRGEVATLESERARRAAAQLLYKDARDLADARDLVNARARAVESLSLHDNADARGLLAAIATLPEPTSDEVMELPECIGGEWALTPDPDEAICFGFTPKVGEGVLASWYVGGPSALSRRGREGRWRWTHMIGREKFESCSPEQVRSQGDVLRVHSHLHEGCHEPYVEYNRGTGVLINQDSTPGTFALSSDTLRLHKSRRHLVGAPETRGVCRGRILNAAVRDVHETWLLCDDYEVWRVTEGRSALRVPVAPEDRAHAIAFRPITKEPWLTSSQGQLFTLGETHTFWDFGEAIKEMRFIEGTSLLVMLGLHGKLRIFDTEARRWRYTMPARYNDISVDQGARVRAIRSDGVVVSWRLDVNPQLSRYAGPSGFAMAAWSRDQDLILGLDGQGRVHVVEHETGKVWGPFPWSERVGKWVTASPTSNSFHIVGVEGRGIYTVKRVGDDITLERDPRFVVHPSVFKRMMISPDELALFVHYGSDDVVLERAGSQRPFRKALSFGAPTTHDADTSSQHSFVAVVSSTNITRWDWEQDRPELVYEHDDEVRAVSIDEAGAVLAVTRDTLHVFDDRLAHVATWPIDAGAILDVEWIPGRGVAALAHLDGRVTFWDVSTGGLLARGAEHSSRVTKLDVTKDGQRVLSVGWDGLLVVWDVVEAIKPRSELVHRRGSVRSRRASDHQSK